MKPRQFIARISPKKVAANGGKYPSSSISSPRKAVRKSKRKPSEFARIYGSKARVEWVKSLPCSAPRCGFEHWTVEGHHIETGGTGYKADYTKIIPLCSQHHRFLHDIGRESFEARYGFKLETLAAETERLWKEHSGAAV